MLSQDAKKKVGRRLSARVGELFKSKPKKEAATTPKVEENPPKLDEHTPAEPLGEVSTAETPAAAAPVEEAPAAAVEAPAESTPEVPATAPAATPVVAATA